MGETRMEEFEIEKQKKKDLPIGVSRVNLTQGIVESAKFTGWEDSRGTMRHMMSYRARMENFFEHVHLSDAENEELSAKALSEAYWQGQDVVSKTYWAERRGTRDIVWVRVDVRIVPRLETGDLIAFFNNWDVSRGKNLDRMMTLLIELDYDYIEYISAKNGYYEVVAKERSSVSPPRQGRTYDKDIADYLRQVAVCDNLEEKIAQMQLEAICAHLEKQNIYIQEIDLREADGSVRRKLLRYAYLDRETGTIVKSCADIEDIVKKEKQEQLERALEEAERANNAKSEFLANMSHDIRTPMNAIIGLSAIAREESTEPAVRDYLKKISESGEFLLGLINDVLDISKIESGNLKLKPRIVPLEEFDSAINTNIRPIMEEKNITFRYEMRCGVDCVYADPIRFNQVFFNLLTNAAKYTPNGGEVVFSAISLSREKNVEWVRFSVRDTGIGMSREFLERAFEPFAQENNQTMSQQWQGTGLGLSIVHKLVSIMDGRVEIHSEQGKGTVVIVDLPLRLGKPQGRPKKTVQEKQLQGLKNMRVLLAEDNDINAFVARRLLENKGIQVEHVSNGREAVDAVEGHDPGYYDVVILDIRMPVMGGLEAAREIRGMDRVDAQSLPLIAMTANVYDEDMERSIAAGMNAHLAKPIEPQKLFETLIAYA